MRRYRAAVTVRPQSRPQTADAASAARAPVPSGARSAAVVGAASLLATALNYLFLLAAARALGSDDYGSLAALLGVLTVALLPAGAVQLAVSREIAQKLATGDDEGADAFAWATLRLGAIVTRAARRVALLLAVPLRELLSIDSAAAVVLTASALAPAFVFPVAMGVLLGEQRFHAVASFYVLPFALRLVLFAGVTALGFRLGRRRLRRGLRRLWFPRPRRSRCSSRPLRRGMRAARPSLAPVSPLPRPGARRPRRDGRSHEHRPRRRAGPVPGRPRRRVRGRLGVRARGAVPSRDASRGAVPAHSRPPGARRGDGGHPRALADRDGGLLCAARARLCRRRARARRLVVRRRVRRRRRAPRDVHGVDVGLLAREHPPRASTSRAASAGSPGSSRRRPRPGRAARVRPVRPGRRRSGRTSPWAAALLVTHELAVGRSWPALRAGARQLWQDLGIRGRHLLEAGLALGRRDGVRRRALLAARLAPGLRVDRGRGAGRGRRHRRLLGAAARGRLPRVRHDAAHPHGRTDRLARDQRPPPPVVAAVLPRLPADEGRRRGRGVQPRRPRRVRPLRASSCTR